MKKFLIVLAIVLVIGGVSFGAWALLVNDSSGDTSANEAVSTTQSAPIATEEPEAEVAEPTTEVPVATSTTPTVPAEQPTVQPSSSAPAVEVSRYVTLAEFNSDPSAYSSQRKVYFFHAPWCPICKAIDEDIRSDVNQIPAGTTFIKTDFDSNTALRQKYGVTYQYTFVQVDSSLSEQKQWSATTLDKAIAGLQ